MGWRLQIRNSTAKFLIFTAQADDGSIEVRVEEETVWLTQTLMAELFGVSVPTIRKFRITPALTIPPMAIA